MPIKKMPIETAQLPTAVIMAVRKILRPLVRLLLSFRITFPQLVEQLKSVYVEIAEQEFRLLNKSQTDTRLTLLTGIHRKEVKRLRHEISAEKETPMVIDIGGKLIARWIGETIYQNKQGKPLPLPLKAKEGVGFQILVQEVCKQDIRPRVILDEWLNLGIVSIDKEKRVCLNSQAFIPSKGLDEKAFFLGHNISDHLAAATHNLLDQQPAFFERCVYYDELSDDSIQQLRELAAKQGMETLLAINQLALQLKKRDILNDCDSHYNHRINIGLYVYDETKEK